MWVAFQQNTCELDAVLTRAVNILTTNELVKLTMLWTTGPGLYFAHGQDDLNPHILRMFEGTFSLNLMTIATSADPGISLSIWLIW